MRKLIAVAALLVSIFTASDVSAAQPGPSQWVAYGNKCCDVDPIFRNIRFRCFIDGVAPLGNACWCPGVYGTGFVCR